MSDNELIAEFMGLVKCDPDLTYNLEHWRVATDYPEDKTGFVAYGHQLEYDKSWDWLMPVVEKIATLAADKNGEIRRKAIDLCTLPVTSKIEWVYKYTVDFIKWYKSVQQ